MSGTETIAGVASSITAFVDGFPRGPLERPVQCRSYADFEREFGGIDAASPASYGIYQFFQNGGGECWVVRVATDADASGAQATPGATADALIGAAAEKTGIHALDDVDLVNILCLPRAAELIPPLMASVYAAGGRYMSGRRGFLLIDIPETTASPAAMQTWLGQNDALRSRNAAVYFPRTVVPDPAHGPAPRNIAASGTLAGLYARTDATRGIWKAPAGIDATLRNVQALACPLTDVENDALAALGVNCLRSFPAYGKVCWGARTLDGTDRDASEWKYIPIVRFALYIEESLVRGTQGAAFEPNDEPLWERLRRSAGEFMHNLFRRGAFQGSRPQDAYFVRCDASTTTPADRQSGIVNIEIGFAPLRPAEFVIFTVRLIAGHRQQTRSP